MFLAHDGPRPSDVDVSYIYNDDFTLAQIQASWNVSVSIVRKYCD